MPLITIAQSEAVQVVEALKEKQETFERRAARMMGPLQYWHRPASRSRAEAYRYDNRQAAMLEDVAATIRAQVGMLPL